MQHNKPEVDGTLNVTENNPDEKKGNMRYDKHIWGIYITLCIISIIELYSASSREITMSSMGVYWPIMRHVSMLAVGFLIILGLQKVHYRWFFYLGIGFAVMSVLMMVYVIFFGDVINGARRSFTFLGVMIQPAEFLKLSAVLVIAHVMSRFQSDKGVTTKGVIYCALAILVFCGLLFEQGLTNTILLGVVSISVMWVCGIQKRKFILVICSFALLGGVVLFLKMTSVSEDKKDVDANTEVLASQEKEDNEGRASTWLNRLTRWSDTIPLYERKITAENRQEMYSYMAQANGGFFGVWPGNSRETARLPLANIDYIYAIIVEDLGFAGGFVVLVLYLWLLARAFAVATRCSRAFPAMLVLGAAVMITYQALFHMAIVTGVFPVSGQPLPLISKGGSSILITSIAFGLMLSVSKHAVRRSGRKKEIKAEIDALPEQAQADNPILLD